VTWSFNRVCHYFGTRRFETDDCSTNILWLALPSLDESCITITRTPRYISPDRQAQHAA
jgi:hypothetical protein